MSLLDRSGPLRRVLFQVHLWVGVAAALYVLAVSVTGAVLVFRIHLQRAVHPELFTAQTDGPQADIATILERVRDGNIRGRLSGVDAPTTVRPTHLAYVTEDGQFHTVLIDPVTADVLGELPENSVVRTLQDLHFDLLAGPTGRVINGVGALCLLLLCTTGLVVWWPGRAGWRRGFTVDWRRPCKLAPRTTPSTFRNSSGTLRNGALGCSPDSVFVSSPLLRQLDIARFPHAVAGYPAPPRTVRTGMTFTLGGLAAGAR